MKYLIALASLFALALSSQAQSYDLATLSTAGGIASGATSNYTYVVNVRKASSACLQMSFKLDGAGTGGVIAKVQTSADGENWETTPSMSFTNSANGTSTVIAVNQLTLKGAQAIRLYSIENGGGANLTNLVLKVGIATR